MFCTYIIPTIGRASLDIAVNSVLNQDFSLADFEVVVVNDSGQPLAKRAWSHPARVRVIDTNRSERSYARNAGAAIARGEYLAFLDDDDWILPGALQDFWQLAQQNNKAAWLYGGIRIVDEAGKVLGEINSQLSGNCFAQFMGGSWAPLQSSMIRADAFFAVGAFNPHITGTEDEDLTRRVAYYGSFANTPKTVACLLRGPSWSTTTNYLRGPQDTKYSRDLILANPGAFRRLWASANSSYWRGRMLRVYASTISWNLKRKRILNALSRALYTLAGWVLSLPFIISPRFWQGFRAEHVPHTLHFVIQDYERKSRQKPTG
ncbi:MAG TPA: glycosyltransferase family A protein [Levilinea sp.]|nr:glycosyltransferase family A protein [Levilinea sp.]